MDTTYSDKERRTGRTTRLADDYIQKLFENYQDDDKKMTYVQIVDHFPGRFSDLLLVWIIKRRIFIEHGLDCDVKGTEMRIKTN